MRCPPPARSLLLAFLASAACGGGSGSPSGPGTPSPGVPPGSNNQSCRQIPSTYTSVEASNFNVSATCSFNASTVQLTCTEQVTSPFGDTTVVGVMTWRTRGDVVDEVAGIPPLRKATTYTVTEHGALRSSFAFSYDGQGRLVQEVDGPGPGGTTTYTAWDAAGRPTAGTKIDNATGTTINLSMTYDDADRSMTATLPTATCTTVYDANGFATHTDCVPGGRVRTATPGSTFQVCR